MLGSVALTPWRADPIEDRQGCFVYLRDRDEGSFWSLGREPVRGAPEAYSVAWHPGRFEITRRERGIETTLETCVVADRPAEAVRIQVHNLSHRRRTLEITSYAEVLLHDPAAGLSHPAFAKLFVETDLVEGALLARRRPRDPGQGFPILVHALSGPGSLEHETDRVRWIGRGLSLARPRAMVSGEPLSGTTGGVLDPIVSLRRAFELLPSEVATFVLLLGACAGRVEALELARRFVDPAAAEDALANAERRRREEIARGGHDASRAERAEALAVALLYGDRAVEAIPLVDDPNAIDVSREPSPLWLRLGVGDAEVLLARAHVMLEAGAPEVTLRDPAEALLVRPGRGAAARPAEPAAAEEALLFDNGWGGFAEGGREYVIRVRPVDGGLEGPPLPWINVLANPEFGAIVSETGAGTTWSRNSQQHRLTPWANDPLLDPHGEALYLRDDGSGEYWSPLPGPTPARAAYEVRHGFGCTRFLHSSHDLEQESVVFVARDEPVKVTRLRLTNRGPCARRLTLVAYQRLVLGTQPEETRRFVTTRFDAATEALMASNAAAREFADGVAFAAAVRPEGVRLTSWTTDRECFLGARGTLGAPDGLEPGRGIEPRAGSRHDPCFAIELSLEVPAGGAVECGFLLGEARGEDEARALIRRWREPDAIERGLEAVRMFWTRLLDRVQIETPSPEIDLLVNGWLAYQTLASRLWGRTALYQSGGAFGYRDQLQDALALGAYDPSLARRQILLHAAHQFPEGDVLHWWHPPGGLGIRTRFADDLLWLPHATADYVRRTGDRVILDERVPFVMARALVAHEDEALVEPSASPETDDLYGHCCRAIDRSLAFGRHGLPLFGAGDWNDGMNRVGRNGGESVWMGFFLHAVLGDFLPHCRARGDEARAGRYAEHREQLRSALEGAWDGAWYRRGFYGDGAPLGSATSDECRIDALAQAWAVISGAAPEPRARAAMEAVERELVSQADGLIRLLRPPFDRTARDPGYIKAYLPGVRENGGQYTHAALWVVRALAELGKRDRAAELLAMLSPVRHGGSRERAARYRGEPYVIAADVYGAEPHVGRVGWTWYTGSAGWMLRVALESVLGIRFENGRELVVAPRVPDAWPRFHVSCTVPGDTTRVEIDVVNPSGRAESVVAARVDGRAIAPEQGAIRVALPAGGGVHHVEVELG